MNAAADRPADHEVDLLIVGAGPTGLFATYYAGFRGLRVGLVDSLPALGGQISALYPEKLIFDTAGHPAIRGQDLVDNLVAQARTAEPLILLEETAVAVDDVEDGLLVTTAAGTTVRAGALLVTAGIGTFEPRELPAGSEYAGRGLRYFVPHLADLAGQDVVVVGGGDSAVDWALALEPLAASVTLVHRRPAFRAHERSVALLESSSVQVLTPFEVEAVDGGDRVASVTVVSKDGDRKTLPADTVVAALGFIADLGPLESWGLELHRRHIIVDRSMATSRDRIFAAGDIAHFDGKIKLIAVGFGEAATAVNHAAHRINPAAPLSPGHSTDA